MGNSSGPFNRLSFNACIPVNAYLDHMAPSSSVNCVSKLTNDKFRHLVDLVNTDAFDDLFDLAQNSHSGNSSNNEVVDNGTRSWTAQLKKGISNEADMNAVIQEAINNWTSNIDDWVGYDVNNFNKDGVKKV